MTEAKNPGKYGFSPVNTAFVRAMYKKGTGNDKQGKTREIERFARIEILAGNKNSVQHLQILLL